MTLAQLTVDVKVIVDILARLVDFGLIDIIHEKISIMKMLILLNMY